MIESAAAVIQYKDKIFIIKRQNFLGAFPGYFAFPGGKVDKGETILLALEREISEELGISLSQLRYKGKPATPVNLGAAITPKFNPYRFSNHFFKIVVDELPTFILERGEIESGEWITPKLFIKKYLRGGVLIVPPILRLIEALLGDSSLTSFDGFNRYGDEDDGVPMIESICGIKQFIPLSNTFPPVRRTNSYLIGNCLVDPSPKDMDELDRFFDVLKEQVISKIFITHSHPDHYEFVPQTARKFSCPVLLSKKTFKFILEREGEEYFSNTKIEFAKEGDIVTTFLGKPVFVYEIPGHDMGHLGLAPEDLSWFLVGDLIQTFGTVVVGGKEGNMGDYFNSLRRVIDLKPQAVLPSHGMITGGVDKLTQTLKHRLEREQQVKEMLAKGLTPQEMLVAIYGDLEENLKKYALMNINSHITKVRGS